MVWSRKGVQCSGDGTSRSKLGRSLHVLWAEVYHENGLDACRSGQYKEKERDIGGMLKGRGCIYELIIKIVASFSAYTCHSVTLKALQHSVFTCNVLWGYV